VLWGGWPVQLTVCNEAVMIRVVYARTVFLLQNLGRGSRQHGCVHESVGCAHCIVFAGRGKRLATATNLPCKASAAARRRAVASLSASSGESSGSAAATSTDGSDGGSSSEPHSEDD
jgi:hypothetical protein